MSQLFVIRGYHWGYNDETYYPCGQYIKSTFDNEAAAQKKLLELERAHWQEMDLGETNEFFDGDDKLMEAVNKFTLEKCGEALFDGDDIRDAYIPDGLSDDDFKQFLKIAGLSAYKLTKFDNDPQFYAIWIREDEDYLKEEDECTTALVYAESIDDLKRASADILAYRWDDEKVSIKGELASITENPGILESLISSTKGLAYNANKQQLTIDTSKTDALFSVNDLLKNPLFEIKTLSLEEVKDIESNFAQEW